MRERTAALPSSHAIDYESLLSIARAESSANVAFFLPKHLAIQWCDLYVSAVTRPTNILRFHSRTFEYFFDCYSGLEITGEVAFDQTVEDRVVAVLGIAALPNEPRNGTLGWFEATEVVAETRDKGHFIAHCIGGGGLEVNVFSQDRKLNRGWSHQGRTYRRMETYCRDHPGTF